MRKSNHKTLAGRLQKLLKGQKIFLEKHKIALTTNLSIRLPTSEEDEIIEVIPESFLYCSDASEMDRSIRWYKEEKEADSRTHVGFSMEAIFWEEGIINWNARTSSESVFKRAIQRWRDSRATHNDKIPLKDKSLYGLPFAPKNVPTCWLSWALVVTYKKLCRHRRGLLAIYQEELEKVFFEKLDLSIEVRESYLADFREKVLGQIKQPKKHKGGRHESVRAIDYWKAANLIKFIVEKFIKDPSKESYGEAACVLWIMVWCSYDQPGRVSEDQILALSTSDLNSEEATIEVGNFTIEISNGLTSLLTCLRGRGRGKRPIKLFKNLDNRSLREILKEACLSVLCPKEKLVTPGSFLVFPHVFKGVDMPIAQRRAMMRMRQMDGEFFEKAHKTQTS